MSAQSPPDLSPILLRPAEAAALLAVSRSQLYALAKRGELPGVVRLSGSVRLHRETLERWLADRAEAGGGGP